MISTTTTLATDWADASIAIAFIGVVGALVLLVVWQIFSLLKRRMELRAAERRDDRPTSD